MTMAIEDYCRYSHVLMLVQAGEADVAPGDAQSQEEQQGDTDDCVSTSGDQ